MKKIQLDSPFSNESQVVGMYGNGVVPPSEWVARMIEQHGYENILVYHDDFFTYWYIKTSGKSCGGRKLTVEDVTGEHPTPNPYDTP